MDELAHVDRLSDDLEVLTEILTAFRKLEPASRESMLNAVATVLGLGVRVNGGMSVGASHHRGSPTRLETTFSADRSVSAKQFMLEKQPRTDVEKATCLAYYLTHYRGVEHFKTLDISKLNTEAAQSKFTNAAHAVDNATKLNYLVPASKGNKQLSAQGEQFVLALPDREKARSIMANVRPRRRARRINQQTEDRQ